MAQETPEIVERQMSVTRQSLTDKITALEHRLVGTVDEAAATVRDTVETVRHVVADTGDVVESLKRNAASLLDVRGHVQKTPWLCVGIAATAGFVSGFILTPRRASQRMVEDVSEIATLKDEARPKAGLVSHLVVIAEGELKKFGETAIISASKSLQKAFQDEMPQLVDRIVQMVAPNANGSPRTTQARV